MSDCCVLKYPKGEFVWVQYYDKNGDQVGIMTTKPARDCYYLYGVENGEFVKLGKSASPLELETKYKMRQRMGIL